MKNCLKDHTIREVENYWAGNGNRIFRYSPRTEFTFVIPKTSN